MAKICKEQVRTLNIFLLKMLAINILRSLNIKMELVIKKYFNSNNSIAISSLEILSA